MASQFATIIAPVFFAMMSAPGRLLYVSTVHLGGSFDYTGDVLVEMSVTDEDIVAFRDGARAQMLWD